eukprot:647311-Amphidinium_carterae.1
MAEAFSLNDMRALRALVLPELPAVLRAVSTASPAASLADLLPSRELLLTAVWEEKDLTVSSPS